MPLRFSNSVTFKFNPELHPETDQFVQVGDHSWGYWCLVPLNTLEDRKRLQYLLDALNIKDAVDRTAAETAKRLAGE